MTEEQIDTIGKWLWYAIFLTPLVAFPLVWRNKSSRLVTRILVGIALSCILSTILYGICLMLAFRHGMGPV